MSAGKGGLVLVVEGNADLRNALMRALSNADFSPMCVSSVRDALFKLKNQKFSCIIVDLLLEGESGETLVELIRTGKDAKNEVTPILITGASLNRETLQRLAGKIQGAMVKPINIHDLVAATRRLMK